MKNNIILLGMMGAGKTLIGKKLKEILPELELVDVDEYIENKAKMKISDIFAKYSENFFRDIETEAIKELCDKENQIISLGGGAFERKENRKMLNNNGKTIYLRATAQSLFDRIKSETHRPLLQRGFGVEKVQEILSKRAQNYEKASIIIDTDGKTPYNIIEEIQKRIAENA